MLGIYPGAEVGSPGGAQVVEWSRVPSGTVELV